MKFSSEAKGSFTFDKTTQSWDLALQGPRAPDWWWAGLLDRFSSEGGVLASLALMAQTAVPGAAALHTAHCCHLG